MKIAIIGGSGFVGSRLIEEIKNKVFEIKNFDKAQSQTNPEITTICDVRNLSSLKNNLKSFDIVILLAAEHRDDVSPHSLYYDVNVQGVNNVCEAMDYNGIKNIIFTSSVAIYGLNKVNPNESNNEDPFNHYGKSKWQAEEVLRKWHSKGENRTINILRPTVIFGENNRGNVYNLLESISSGKFKMVGKGENKKSMAYVGNIVSFIQFLIETIDEKENIKIYNYADKPDMNMNELISVVGEAMNKNISSFKIPYFMGMLAGYCFDILAFITRKKLTISSVRVKKFCATTQFDSTKAMYSGYAPKFSLSEGLSRTIKYEFIDMDKVNRITFEGGG